MAGFFTNAGYAEALSNSKGLFAFNRRTLTTFSNTARTKEDNGSGWSGTNADRIAGMDPVRMVETAAKKAELSRNAKQLDPGQYTVILEPSAVADPLMYMNFSLDTRSADEGRTFFSKKGGGTKLAFLGREDETRIRHPRRRRT